MFSYQFLAAKIACAKIIQRGEKLAANFASMDDLWKQANFVTGGGQSCGRGISQLTLAHNHNCANNKVINEREVIGSSLKGREGKATTEHACFQHL